MCLGCDDAVIDKRDDKPSIHTGVIPRRAGDRAGGEHQHSNRSMPIHLIAIFLKRK